MTIRTILVALAMDEGGTRTAARALQLAHEHHARLVAVHIIEDLPPDGGSLPAGLDHPRIEQRMRDEARGYLKDLLSRAEPPAEIHVETGKPHLAINDLADRSGADLIVIGPGVAQGLRERVFGSTADRVIRCGPVPVLVVRGEVLGPYRHVTIGVDFSDHARSAVAIAARIAPGARHEFLHTVEIPLGLEQAMLKVGTAQADIARYRATRGAAARQRVTKTYGRDAAAAEYQVRIAQGDPASALISASRRRRTDLVAIGTQGVNAVARHLLGSVARKVLSHARCDVLVAHRP